MKTNIDAVALSGIRAFAQRYASLEDMVFLTIGEPDLDTPAAIKEAAIAALNENHTHYPPALGNMDLRQKIAAYESSFYGENFDAEQVVVVNGATEGLALALWSLLEPGDEVIIPTPSFTLYQSQTQIAKAKPVLLDISKTNFQIDVEQLMFKVNAKTKAVVFASPNNPTGTIYNQSSFDALIQMLELYPDIYIIIDEVYRSMVYDVDYVSFREIEKYRDRIILVTSFSKSHAMTGWRVGYVIAPMPLLDTMHKLHQNIVTGISNFTQKACLTALDLDTSDMVAIYKEKRQFVLEALDAAGLEYAYPDGAFYVFINIERFDMDSISFAEKMAEEVKLVVVPGIYFGTDNYIRISYGGSDAILEKGLSRLQSFIASLSKE